MTLNEGTPLFNKKTAFLRKRWQGYLVCIAIIVSGLCLAYFKADPFRTLAWTRVPCSVEALSVGWWRPDSSGSRPRIVARFTYAVDGIYHSGTNAFLESEEPMEFGHAYRLLEQQSSGRLSSCLVNPQAPSEAVLAHLPSGCAGQFLFGLCFAMLGLAAFRAVGGNPNRPDQRHLPLLLGITAGLVFMTWITTAGVVTAVRASGWTQVQAAVEYSGQRQSRGKGGRSTWHPDIVYRYSNDGQIFLGNSVNAPGSGPATKTGRAELTAQYPVGGVAPIWVNPNDPTESILNRAAGWGWIFALIPLALGAMLIDVIRKILRQPHSQRGGSSAKRV